MANADTPMGFQPYRHRGGGVIRSSGDYKIQSGFATALFTGDAVVLTSGYLARAADSSGTIIGIFEGCRFRDTDGAIKWQPNWVASATTLGSEDVQAFVYTDPMISYRCQSDTGTAYVDATHKGGVFDIELDHNGSAITGLSGMEIDLSDTGTGQFLVIGLIDEPENAVGVNAKLEVLIKESHEKVN